MTTPTACVAPTRSASAPFDWTASKLVAATRVRDAAFGGFALACVAGLWLASRTSWWLVVIGATAVLAGWFYTGGPKPYGYYGFGELFVFVYFGLVATVGTAYTQHLVIPSRAWWSGVATGFMACALLEANNLRDVDGDRAAGTVRSPRDSAESARHGSTPRVCSASSSVPWARNRSP